MAAFLLLLELLLLNNLWLGQSIRSSIPSPSRSTAGSRVSEQFIGSSIDWWRKSSGKIHQNYVNVVRRYSLHHLKSSQTVDGFDKAMNDLDSSYTMRNEINQHTK